ncbi:MAG: XcyI family restriction endonuclease [Candidatus Diapherotrites archaeon]|uniref:XcyI family restriction endonuclease n=1 Tax=Candidatus Iainarchaeum sp. TaxID=3101447 RepID=A0A8T3YHE9_9ARCH|nr:XcyI family restriction endonuclease [Candidatus Diapherotrites archaeon]
MPLPPCKLIPAKSTRTFHSGGPRRRDGGVFEIPINYRLRSTFFYNKLNEYHTYEFSETIQKLIPLEGNFDWAESRKWGIAKKALDEIKKTKLSLIQVFCHPRLLREHPALVSYYRNIAALSQKSVSYLAGISPQKFENEKGANPTQEESLKLAKLFNEHISLIIENALEGFNDKHISGMLFASTGSQIDGSWRNAIGTEAEKVVQKMLVKEAIERNQIISFLVRDNHSAVEKYNKRNSVKQIDNITNYKGFTLKNKRSVLFSSEPDIAILGSNGRTIAVIEVKGGTDPAGALERYGVAKKSFEKSLKDSPKALTIIVASCITNEVESRIETDKTIGKYYNLTSILTKEEEKKKFLQYIFKNLLNC